jgi:hypothetical protein
LKERRGNVKVGYRERIKKKENERKKRVKEIELERTMKIKSGFN